MSDKSTNEGRQPPSNEGYAVGNCRPPVATRFQPFCSGNLKGRPKGSKNFSTLLDEELAEIVVVIENGKRKPMPKRRAFVKKLVNGNRLSSITFLETTRPASSVSLTTNAPSLCPPHS
jgi:hypothetical protein